MSDKELPKELEGESAENLESLDQSTTETVEESNTESVQENDRITEDEKPNTLEALEVKEEIDGESVETAKKTSKIPETIEEIPEKSSKVPEETTEAVAESAVDITTTDEIIDKKADGKAIAANSEVPKTEEEPKAIEDKIVTTKTAGTKTKKDDEEVTSSDEEHHDEKVVAEEKDYHSLSKENLITEFQALLKDKSIQHIKHDVEEIKTEFNAKFDEELEHKKEEFLAEGGNIIDFHYTTPLKKQFNSLYFDYKEKLNNYYKNLKRDLQENYKKRKELIDELKGLLNAEENINTTYRHFKDIQERWHTAGAIPRDKYNTIWNTYHHHVENFYDFLHLNREFRDMDFKHNLDQKLKIIGRAEELAQQEDIARAFRELQMLHKMWKEDVGPVAKEFRDEVWEKFSDATKVIHDKRHEFIKDQEKHFEVNFDLKNAIIDKINEVSTSTSQTHKAWQNAIKEVQKLRDAYFETGKVPRNKAKEIWNRFKESTRSFNKVKNAFYKNQKKEQYTNLEKKRELIKIAEENKDSEDFEVVTPLMKKIQSDWKSIGHVPRKESDKIWKQFKEACNHYFNKVHAERNELNKEESVHFDAKQALLDSLSSLKMSGEVDADLQTIKEKIAEWKAIGRVPYNKKNIERKFNKALDDLFGKLNLDKQQSEMIRFENKLNSLASEDDHRKLQNEEFFISKRITETKDEIRQLENNLGFFRHAKQDNPLVVEVHNNIAKHKEQLDVWKSKLSKIRSLRKHQ